MSFEHNTTCGAWNPMGEKYYRKFEVYAMEWDPDTDVSSHILAGAPCGGPIALARDETKLQAVGGGALRGAIRVFSLAGRLLAEIAWRHGRIAGLGWTDDATLLAVTDAGHVHAFTALGRALGSFALGDALRPGERVQECLFWGRGMAALTSQFGVVCASFAAESGGGGGGLWAEGATAVVRLADTGLAGLLPECWIVVPPETPQQSPMALLATPSGSVVAVDADERLEHDLKRGPLTRMCLSPGGKMLACFVAPYVWVLYSNFSQNLAQFDTQSAEPPEQMAWCGNDSVVLYWDRLVLVVGPHGEWIKYGYDSPLHLVGESDGLRIISNDRCEFLECVPEATKRIFAIGSLNPGAMLHAALDYYDARSPKADENIRAIRDELPQAVESCIDAAAIEFGPGAQRKLLRAAALGKSFIDGYKPDRFVEMGRTIRLLNAVRDYKVGIPLTYTQFTKLGVEGLIGRLIGMDMHLLALRICESMGLAPHRVLTHWACQKVRTSADDTGTLGQILAALRGRSGIPFARIAAAAFAAGRKDLATKLIEHEPRSSEQVPLLQRMGLRELALDKALESGDTDLAFGVLIDLIESAPAGTTGWFDVVRTRPEAVDLLMVYFRQHDVQMLKRLLLSIDAHTALAALTAREAYTAPDFELLVRTLRDVQSIYAGAPREQYALQAKFTEDQLRLLLAQRELELSTGEQLFGLSLAATIARLLAIGDAKNAGKLRSDFKVSDKKWWWLRLRAIADNPDALTKFGQLEKLAREKKSPIGYEPFVQVCIDSNVHDEAVKYILMITDIAKRVPLFVQAGKFHEAADAAFKAKDAELLQFVAENSRSEADRGYAEALRLQLVRK